MHPIRMSAYFDILSQSQKAYSKQLEPVCRKWDLTRSAVDVLLFLYNNPDFDRAVDVVNRRGMTKSHVSMSVAELADRNLLERQYSPEDRRTVHLHLLEEGRKIAAEAREAQQNFFNALYEGVTPEELAVWEKITHKVYGNIEELYKALFD